MKYLNLLLFILIASCAQNNTESKNEQKNSKNIDTLKFSYSGFNAGQKLYLLTNGHFINDDYYFSCFGGGERNKVFGTYKMDSLSLTLFPETIEFTEYPIEMEVKPKVTKMKYGVDSLKIKTNFQVVRWENTKYLLSEVYYENWKSEQQNDYMRFADYLNNGYEPETSGNYLVHKTKDSITSAFDVKQIPEKWQSYILKEPIIAKIKSIQKIIDPNDQENIYWKIELDKGKNDRVNNRLTFTTQDGEFFMEVDSILSNKSFGKTYFYDFTPKKFPIGTELRTKWK
uniref:hypothetical protein n=1 Tax=Flavobacterium sp. TaxID=239 RepID=UPI004049D55C